MTDGYRIIHLNGYYRLMCGDKLQSTHSSEAAASVEMQKRMQAEAEARPARTITELFKAMRENARAAPAYNDADWREFSERFNEVYARAYAARKGE